MTATISHEIDAGRLVTAFAATDPATGPPRDVVLDHQAASAGGPRPEFRRNVGAALARGGRAVVDVVRRMRDGLTRRQAVRELRRLGRSRLADLGIEPDRIEHVVDAMIAARRNGTATRGGRWEPRSE